ncbi:topoisomerase VIA/SpoII nuclease subunit [Cryptosporidium ryanae]|uniref:topoisomerase VIA/SpoII nuclease subunit n=1 Tax=Cryptosporidium ryanae TaxID=515981 RepID=UPI00351A3F49|nr:topoisomerase VIA/SpoII nuclease subunit [Cryptosporidium ryanae]
MNSYNGEDAFLLKDEIVEYKSEKDVVDRLENEVRKELLQFLNCKSSGKIYNSVCLLSVMNILHRNIIEGYHATLRDIYYGNPGLYKKQVNSNKAIALLTHLIKTPREFLNVVSTSKGRIRGPLAITGFEFETDKNNSKKHIKLDFMSLFENTGHSISPYIFKSMKSLKFNVYKEVKFVLIVEKDTIFQRLLEINFMKKFDNSCILITAKGFPDIPTRTLLYKLSMELPKNTLFFIICDYDCYGLSIAENYLIGGKSETWYDSGFTISKIRPLKIPPVSILIESEILMEDSISTISENEMSRIVSTKERFESFPEIKEDIRSEWIHICKQMINDLKKFEIDCIVNLEDWIYKFIEKEINNQKNNIF